MSFTTKDCCKILTLVESVGIHTASIVLLEIEYAKLEDYTGSAVRYFWGKSSTLLYIFINISRASAEFLLGDYLTSQSFSSGNRDIQ